MKVNVLLIGAAMAAMAGGAGAAELPPLFGDGVHDDTAAIQARLDAQEEIAIQLQTTAEKAVWRELGAEPIELRVRAAGDRRTVTVPSIGAWGMGYLEVR